MKSDETRRLTLPPDVKPAIIQGRFRFAPETIGWGNIVLAEATPCQLLVVDELGPLELERKGGWQEAFDVLRRGHFALALVVIRSELVVKAQLWLPISATTVFAVTPENASLPPHCIPTTRSETGHVSLRRSLSFFNFFSASSTIPVTMASNP